LESSIRRHSIVSLILDGQLVPSKHPRAAHIDGQSSTRRSRQAAAWSWFMGQREAELLARKREDALQHVN
jgi:hypothetical protein